MEVEKLEKRLKLNKIVLSVLLILLLIILIVVLVKCTSVKNLISNNDSNMGMATSGDNYTFYYKYNSGLVKIKDGKEYQIVDGQAYSIQYDKEYVYYTTPNNNGGIDIKKASQNGDTNEVLISVNSELTKMYLSDGFLYYTTSNPNTISKINVNNKEQSTVLTRAILDFKVLDGIIYFIDDMRYLYQLDVNGENYKTIEENPIAKKFQMLDNEIYFYDEENQKLMKINLKNKKKSEVTDKLNCDVYNVTSNGIYYLDNNDMKICCVDLKNKKSKEIISVSTANTKINVIGNVIYYLDLDNDSYVTKRISIKGKKVDEVKY